MDIEKQVKDIVREEFYLRVKPIDHENVLRILREISDSSDEFSEFEADFIKEVARLAIKFQEKLRLSKKQSDALNKIWFEKVFNKRIDAKIKKE